MAFADLYRREGLVRLDQAFLHFLQEGEPSLRARLDHGRANHDSLERKAESALLIEIAPWMEDFIARLFGVEKEVAELAARHHELAPLYSCKRQFVQRRAMNKVSDAEAAAVERWHTHVTLPFHAMHLLKLAPPELRVRTFPVG